MVTGSVAVAAPAAVAVTVTTYVPGVVPLPPPAGEAPLLPHPTRALVNAKRHASIASITGHLRLFARMPSSSTHPKKPAPASSTRPAVREGSTTAPDVGAVVETVSVAAPLPPPATVTGLVEPKLMEGTSVAPCGADVTTAVSETLPVNPPVPVTVTMSLALPPGTTETAEVVGARFKMGGALIVSAIVVDDVILPAVPVIVTVALPMVAALPTVNISPLAPVVGLVPKLAVTPLGNPDAARVTLLVNPLAPVTVMVSEAVFPCITESAGIAAASVKLGAALTLSAIVVEALRLPEVPVIVTVTVPAVAELPAVSVNTLDPDVGLVPKLAVTPLGRPVATRDTLPVKPLAPETVIVSVALLPCVTDKAGAMGASVKLGAALTVRLIVVEALKVPDVPLIVTVTVPVIAVLPAVNVIPLDPVVGLVAKFAVTPLGKPVAPKVTPPVNPLAPVTVIVSVALLPRVTDKADAVGARVKLGTALTVKLCGTWGAFG